VSDPTVADPDLLAGRLFFAVPVPGAARAPVEEALPRLEPLLGQARVTPPGGWHLTLAFLGQVRPELADEVVRVGEAAVAGIPPVLAGLRAEDRVLHPHLTLARFSRPAPVPQEALALIAGAAEASQPWEARELACYRSILGGPRGARYRVVREFPLAG
jgi:2'-5' RNA ligase